MATKNHHFIYWLTFSLLASLQLIVICQYELFGDEAFYWLEGQNLAWSYAELPGFTAWILAFSEWLFPHHPAFLRLIPWLAALSIPFLAQAINQLIHPHSDKKQAAFLVWSLPLFGVTSVLALPDIWLLFFSVSSIYLLLAATKKHDWYWFVTLGICLALGINVHLRFWLFAALLGIITLWLFRHQKSCLSKLLTISFPLALLGLAPIYWFNLQHDFPLLAFQLKDRHPWSFQLDHLYFIPVQLLVCTPLVMGLWFNLISKSRPHWSTLKNDHKLVMLVSITHWLLYFILGFFSDNLRLNLHWPLLSYALLFLCFSTQNKSWLSNWAIKTGISAHVFLLLLLIYWSQQNTPSNANHRITKHAQGWSDLAVETKTIMTKHNKSKLLVDHFMNTAQLAYQLDDGTEINTLSHPQSIKHGRALQLQIMGYQSDESSISSSLIVIEQTAIKLEDQASFFQSQCKNLGGLKLLSSFNSQNGNKIFHYFEQENDRCDMPVLFYASNSIDKLSGWVLSRRDALSSLTWLNNDKNQDINFSSQSIKGNDMFSQLNPEQYVLNVFQVNLKQCPSCAFQIKAQVNAQFSKQRPQFSQRFYP